MSGMYVVVREFYGDFDIKVEEAVAVSSSETTARMHAFELQEKRTKKDIENEVNYSVSKVKSLD